MYYNLLSVVEMSDFIWSNFVPGLIGFDDRPSVSKTAPPAFDDFGLRSIYFLSDGRIEISLCWFYWLPFVRCSIFRSDPTIQVLDLKGVACTSVVRAGLLNRSPVPTRPIATPTLNPKIRLWTDPSPTSISSSKRHIPIRYGRVPLARISVSIGNITNI